MIAQFVEDGNFSAAAQNGLWRYEYPFKQRGDLTSFVARRKMRQLESAFTPPDTMQEKRFPLQRRVGNVIQLAYLVEISDPSPVEDASGLIEWDEAWASIPIQGVEYGSSTYTQIVALAQGGSSFEYGRVAYGEVSATLDCKTIYDYAKDAPPTTLHAPRFVNVEGGHTFLFGTIHEILAQTGYILSVDSESGIYMGQIFFRKAVYVLRSRPRQIQ